MDLNLRNTTLRSLVHLANSENQAAFVEANGMPDPLASLSSHDLAVSLARLNPHSTCALGSDMPRVSGKGALGFVVTNQSRIICHSIQSAPVATGTQ